MTQSVCILGRQPALGLAELESLYGAKLVSNLAPRAAGLNLHISEVDFARLGGSTRLAHVLSELPSTHWNAVEKALPELITELGLTLPDGKIQLGLSAFGLQVSPAKLNAAGLTLKKALRARLDRSARVIPNPELELSTAQVLHNHLTGPTGIELLLIATDAGHTVIARTAEVQDIESYTLRDRSRPKRDARVGMLPPKLAQIIINLANPSPGSYVVDPFCGTGVLLQEALLMGFSVYGADIEQRMVDYSQSNLEWLLGHKDWLRKNIEEHKSRAIILEHQDATTFQAHNTAGVETVASEVYLGRPFTAKPSAEVLAQTVSEVNLILKKFLRNIHDQLAPGTRLCLAVPAWNMQPTSEVSKYRSIGKNAAQPPDVDTSGIGYRFKHLPLIDQISDLGYNRVKFEHIREEQLIYFREDQIVARELLILTRI